MASDTTKTIAIQALWDGTKLKAGTEESERAVEALADSVETASDQMRASLQSIDDGVTSTLGPTGTFSRSVDDVEVEGGRLSEVGSEVGAEFAANLQEGVASGDLKGSLLDTFSGLGAAAGATGQLGLAAAGVGVLLGATLIKGLSQAAEERRAEFVAAVNEGFQSIEVKARSTFKEIRGELLSTFDFKALLEDLGEGDPTVALGKIQDAAEAINKPFNELVDVLRGDINKENQDTLKALQQQSKEIDYQVQGKGSMIDVLTDEAKLAGDLLDYTRNRKEQLRETTDLARAERDYLQQSADAAERIAAATDRINARRSGDDLQ